MKPSHNITILLTAALLFTSCKPKVVDVKPDEPTDPEKHETITRGGGCYWCVEAVFQQLDGVISATSGFMGGHIPNPSSEEVYSKTSGHIEVVQVVFDPNKISTPEILKWFWKAHNPTDPRGQGVDKGPIYMSNIFAHSPKQRELAEASKKEAQTNFDTPIVTTIRDAEEFYAAKEEHQDYYFRKKGENPYCPQQITPKLKKLGLDY
jgi:peptide-methionine (S)-S-oxide reductase